MGWGTYSSSMRLRKRVAMSSCLRERMGQLVLCHGVSVFGYFWGCGELQACHFLGDGLDPDLEQGKGSGFRADGDGLDVALAEVGLVEHVPFWGQWTTWERGREQLRVMVQAEEIAGVDAASVVEEVGEGAASP